MKYLSDKYIYLIPIIGIVLTLIVSFYVLNNEQWLIIGNVSGYSVLMLSPLLYLYLCTGKYCDFTKVSVIGLFVIAVFNTLSAVLTYYDDSIGLFKTYETNFSILICSIVLFLTGVLYIGKTDE